MCDADVGKLLVYARRAASMSRAQCADGLGVTIAQLIEYERGTQRVPDDVLRKIFRWGIAVVVGAKIVGGKNALCA